MSDSYSPQPRSGGFRSRTRTSSSSAAKSAAAPSPRGESRPGRRGARDTGHQEQRHGSRQSGEAATRRRDEREHVGSGHLSRVEIAHRAREYGVDKPRQVAFEVLGQVRQTAAYANLLLPNLLRRTRLSGQDAAFATELTYGSLRSLGVLDAVIEKVAQRPVSQLTPRALDALRLGTYQLLYTRVAPHAALDTSVNLVRAAGHPEATKFCNGVLRTISRRHPEQWLNDLAPADELGALAFRHAHPRWIAESFAKVLPAAELAAALEADSARPSVHLAALPGELSAEELALIIGGDVGQYSPHAVYLPSGDPGELEPVRQHLAIVQDEGSQLIARAMVDAPVTGPDQGRWLDLCAGPGGKSTLIGAWAATEGAHLSAVEPSGHRAELVREATRGFPVKVLQADGRDSGLQPGFDRVLVDAPCSGLGALRRRPEARWRKQESDIAELNQLQKQLLTAACELVRPGGVVVYSTCSPDLRETREVVDAILAQSNMVELSAHEFARGAAIDTTVPSVQLWPHRNGTDAMFFSVLQRPVSA